MAELLFGMFFFIIIVIGTAVHSIYISNIDIKKKRREKRTLNYYKPNSDHSIRQRELDKLG